MDIKLKSPLDMHLHLREGDMLRVVAPFTADSFSGAVIMPNLISPVNSINKIIKYRSQILEAVSDSSFAPYMTLFFQQYSRQELMAAKEHIIGIKLYPAGVTTQSEKGVTNFKDIEPTFDIMQDLGIPLLVHGETNGFVMDRENEFLHSYEDIVSNFPKLHIIMEHITTEAAVMFLERYGNVSATVTLHHLMITLDDVIGNFMEPHLFCKPVAKKPSDRAALREAVFSGNEKIMFGSDSAPHPRHKKECVGCAAGIFSAPVALQLLVQIFEEENCLERLQGFVSDNAQKRYGIQPPVKYVTLSDTPWEVSETYGSIRPFHAEKSIKWSIQSITD